MLEQAQALLKQKRLVVDDKITDLGWQVLSSLLDHTGQLPSLTPGLSPSPYGIFEKLLSKAVPSAVEMVLVRNDRVFLTPREDRWFGRGSHVPGSYIAPGETIEQTCQRIDDRETPGVKISSARIVNAVNNPDNSRFHDVSVVVGIEASGEPQSDRGRWFSEKPADLIQAHQPLWPIIEGLLR